MNQGMTDRERADFKELLALKSDAEIRELIKAQGIELPADAELSREELIGIASSDDSVPEAERLDLSGD